jgi:hypothetical protein
MLVNLGVRTMQLLSRHQGTWAGTNRFRLMPDDAPAEAPATAQLSLGPGGNIAVLTYTWSHPDDGEQEGLLVLGRDETPGGVVALWGDSWHQQPAAKQLIGTAGDTSVTVGYAYSEGWEWRITLDADGPGVLRWRMDNVMPPSASGRDVVVSYWAMDGDLRPSD